MDREKVGSDSGGEKVARFSILKSDGGRGAAK